MHDDGVTGAAPRANASVIAATQRCEPSRPGGGEPRRPGVYERGVKPVLDRVSAVLLLLLLSPLLVLVTGLVVTTLGWPLIYRQDRVGLGGEPFSLLKFRTMRTDRRRHRDGRGRPDRRGGTDRRAGRDRRVVQIAHDGPDHRSGHERRRAERRGTSTDRRLTHKSANDPRHTRLGRFLRTSSLDELPQLINVVRGEMSLVGPRPELAEIVARYEPWQHARHQVKPGITGLWQVTDRQHDDVMHHHVETDLDYLDQLSAATDLRILALTLPTVLGLRDVSTETAVEGGAER